MCVMILKRMVALIAPNMTSSSLESVPLLLVSARWKLTKTCASWKRLKGKNQEGRHFGKLLRRKQSSAKISKISRDALESSEGVIVYLLTIRDHQPYTTPTKGIWSKCGIFEGVVYELSEPKRAAQCTPPPGLQLRCSPRVLWGWWADCEVRWEIFWNIFCDYFPSPMFSEVFTLCIFILWLFPGQVRIHSWPVSGPNGS